jgi:hypothetical protein
MQLVRIAIHKFFAQLRVKLNITNTIGWYFILLKKGSHLSQHLGQYFSSFNYVKPNYGSRRFILNSRETSHMNRNTHKCNESKDFDEGLCVRKYIDNELNCTIPWQKEPDKNMKKCKSAVNYHKLGDVNDKIMNAGYKKVQEMTGCILACKQTIFDHKPIRPDDEDTNSGRAKKESNLSLLCNCFW